MEYRKNYRKSVALPRKIIASGLSAAFCAGTVGSSYAGATELENPPVNQEANGKLILPELEHRINQNLSENLRLKIEALSNGLYNSIDFSKMLGFLLGNVEETLYGGENIKANLNPVVIESLDILNKDRGMLLDTFILFLIDNNLDNRCITFGCFLFFLNSLRSYKNPGMLSYLVKSRVKSNLTTFSDFFEAHKHVFTQKVKIEEPEVKIEEPEVKIEGPEMKVVEPGVKIKKQKEWKRIIIISVIAIVVIISVFLILRFTLGSKGNELDKNKPNGNNNNNEEQNTNTPSHNENGSKTKQGSGIFGKSLVTLTGTAGGIGAKFTADKVLGHGKQDGNNEKSEKNDKNQKDRDSNGPYTYVDSTVTKAKGKDDSNNIESTNTDVSDTEQTETPNGAEKIEKTKAKGKGVSDNVENADTDVQDIEQAETPNEAEKEETDEEKESKD